MSLFLLVYWGECVCLVGDGGCGGVWFVDVLFGYSVLC